MAQGREGTSARHTERTAYSTGWPALGVGYLHTCVPPFMRPAVSSVESPEPHHSEAGNSCITRPKNSTDTMENRPLFFVPSVGFMGGRAEGAALAISGYHTRTAGTESSLQEQDVQLTPIEESEKKVRLSKSFTHAAQPKHQDFKRIWVSSREAFSGLWPFLPFRNIY